MFTVDEEIKSLRRNVHAREPSFGVDIFASVTRKLVYNILSVCLRYYMDGLDNGESIG